jgi:hypothetical protein
MAGIARRHRPVPPLHWNKRAMFALIDAAGPSVIFPPKYSPDAAGLVGH